MPSRDDLIALKALPLDLKIMKTLARVREWVNFYGLDNTYIAFSGGKDSTVLVDLVKTIYPKIKLVFIDTGLEYPEIRAFVKTFENTTILKPKMRFDEVIKKYGYPLINKEVSQLIYYYRKGATWAVNKIDGKDKTGTSSERKERFIKYKSLISLDFRISSYCCNVMKKSVSGDFEKKFNMHPFIATTTEESYRWRR